MAYQKQTWENLPSQNTPITAERLNHIEDGIEEAYEHGGGGETLPVGSEIDFDGTLQDIPTGWEEIDNPEEYSTDEVKTNKIWIDNKPIYRKVITITEFSSTAVNINTGLTNISEVTSIDGSFNRTGYTRRYPIFNLFMDEWNIDITTGILTMKTNNQYVGFSGYITLEYTKTTD